ncbi:MAG: ATP-binding cassette domain-containing protein [Robiginitomaculum sp.]
MPILKPKSSPAASNASMPENRGLTSPYGMAVELENVSMRYGRGEEVLSGVNLALPAGSMTFLTGPSGAGKSSLLRLIYMAARPSRGLISVFGEDLATLPANQKPNLRKRIGVVLQDFSLIDSLSVFENVALPLRVSGVARSVYAPDVMELLDWVGLGHRLHAQPATLSGGEKQRAAIARAVISKPELLIADEPTGNVDPAMGARLIRLLTEMNRMGTSVLIATHDHELIDAQAPVYNLRGGHLERQR